MTILLLSIIAAMLFFAAIVITNITRISVGHSFGDDDIGELLKEYLSRKIGQKKEDKKQQGGEKDEPPGQDCKK